MENSILKTEYSIQDPASRSQYAEAEGGPDFGPQLTTGADTLLISRSGSGKTVLVEVKEDDA